MNEGSCVVFMKGINGDWLHESLGFLLRDKRQLPKHLLRHMSPTQRLEAWLTEQISRINFDNKFFLFADKWSM